MTSTLISAKLLDSTIAGEYIIYVNMIAEGGNEKLIGPYLL